MYINKYLGLAIVALLVLMLGAVGTMGVLIYNALSDGKEAYAKQSESASFPQLPLMQGAAAGKYIVVPMSVGGGDDALMIMDTSKNTVVVYRLWNGTTFYPVSGRLLEYDHAYVEKVRTRFFSNVRSNDANFLPAALRDRLAAAAEPEG